MGVLSNNTNFTYAKADDNLGIETNSFDSENKVFVSDSSLQIPVGETDNTSVDLDTTIDDEELTENVSLTPEEYDVFVEKVVQYYDEQIGYLMKVLNGDEDHEGFLKLYQDFSTDFSQTDFTNLIEYNASETNMQTYINLINKIFGEVEPDYFDYDFFERETGISFEEFLKLNFDEKKDLIMKNQGCFVTCFGNLIIDHVINYEYYYNVFNYSEIGLFFKKYPFLKSYDEAKQYLNELEYSILCTTEILSVYRQRQKTAYYDYLEYLEDFQNYHCRIFDPMSYDELNAKYGEYWRSCKTNYGFFSFEEFQKKFPGESIFDFVRMMYGFNDMTTPYHIKGDYDLYCDLYYIGKTNDPTFINKYMYYFEKYGEEKANQFLQDKMDEANRLCGEFQANNALQGLYESGEIDDWLAGLLNSLIVGDIAIKHGISDSLDGLGHFSEMIAVALGNMEPNRVRTIHDYKRIYMNYALRELEDKVKNGIIKMDPETGKYVNSNSELQYMDFTTDYPGIMLNLEYDGLKMFGRYLPFMLLAIKFPTFSHILYGMSSAGNTYHQKMVSGDEFTSTFIFSMLQAASYPIIRHFIQFMPVYTNVKDPNVVTGFFKSLLQKITVNGQRFGASVASRFITEQINKFIANVETTKHVDPQELQTILQMLLDELPEV